MTDIEDIFSGPMYPPGTASECFQRAGRVRATAESPIERALALQLVQSGRFVMLPADHAEHELHHSKVAFIPQYKVGRYRLDFYMRFRNCDGDLFQIDVECDGKQYHRHPAAIARDQRRDRELNRLGIEVWRYPGWFLHHHPHIAADEIETAIEEVKRGQDPTITFSHNRETATPTIREFEGAFYAHSRGVPWPSRMGADPKKRGWRHVEHMLEQLHRERRAA